MNLRGLFLFYATMKETNRDFKGVWIPKELYLAEDLSWTEKILLIEIQSLDKGDAKGCYASNEYLGEFLGIKGSSAANMISKLKSLGYLRQLFFDGRNRGLRVTFEGLKPSQKSEGRLHKKVSEPSQKSESEPSQKSEHSNNSIELVNTIDTQERVCAAENSAGKEIDLTANKKPYGEFVAEFEEWYCGKLGIVQIPPYPDNSENLRWLYTNNFTLPEITAYYEAAKSEKWRDGRVTLGTITKEIADFRLKQQKLQSKVYFTTSKPVDVCKLPGLPEMRRHSETANA